MGFSVPVPVPVAAHIHFKTRRLSKSNPRFLSLKFPHLITRNLNGSPNQMQYEQTIHHTSPSLNTKFVGSVKYSLPHNFRFLPDGNTITLYCCTETKFL